MCSWTRSVLLAEISVLLKVAGPWTHTGPGAKPAACAAASSADWGQQEQECSTVVFCLSAV